MKKTYTWAALSGALAGVAGASALTLVMRRRALGPRPRVATYRSADDLRFEEVVPGVSRAVLWGDPERGAYASFTRFEPGAYLRMHTHPNDITLVVLSGAYIYGTDRETARVGPRSAVYLPADAPHVSGGDVLEGCLMFETSPTKFGLTFVEEEEPMMVAAEEVVSFQSSASG